MNAEQLTKEIERIIGDLMREKGLEPVPVSPSSQFVGSDLPIDSLDLAVLVAELEDVTGKDPFKDEVREFHTVRELAQLYSE
jgi:acyl carrier protein